MNPWSEEYKQALRDAGLKPFNWQHWLLLGPLAVIVWSVATVFAASALVFVIAVFQQ